MRRSLAVFALLPLFACASAPSEPAPVPDTGLDTFLYEVSLPSIPEGVSRTKVTVQLPGPSPLRVLAIHGLVGNARFEVPVESSGKASYSSDHVSLSLDWPREAAAGALELTTSGRSVELALRLGLPAGSPAAGELEKTLLASTAASGDGQPIAAVSKRFARAAAPVR